MVAEVFVTVITLIFLSLWQPWVSAYMCVGVLHMFGIIDCYCPLLWSHFTDIQFILTFVYNFHILLLGVFNVLCITSSSIILDIRDVRTYVHSYLSVICEELYIVGERCPFVPLML